MVTNFEEEVLKKIKTGEVEGTDNSDTAAFRTENLAKLDVIGDLLTQLLAKENGAADSYWQHISAYTVEASTDSSNNTTLDLTSLPTDIDDEDLQATITIAPHPDVLTVFYGGTVSGLSEPLAVALMNDAIRWGFGTSPLGPNEGESHAFAAGPLYLTGRPNIVAFRAHSTSTSYPPNLNVKFMRRTAEAP